MIEAIPKRPSGPPHVLLRCDKCGATHEVACDYGLRHGKWVPNEGQASAKATGLGWRRLKRRLICKDCVEARRGPANDTTQPAAQETPMAPSRTLSIVNPDKAPMKPSEGGSMSPQDYDAAQAKAAAPAPRQPTRDQNRQIRTLLDEVYDLEAQRYSRGETDKTVAETIGGGCMPGWVASIREDFYGPAGNAEMDGLEAEIRASITAIRTTHNTMLEEVTRIQNEVKVMHGHLERLAKLEADTKQQLARVEAMKKAIGPKAERL